jgi:hypothetical protein
MSVCAYPGVGPVYCICLYVQYTKCFRFQWLCVRKDMGKLPGSPPPPPPLPRACAWTCEQRAALSLLGRGMPGLPTCLCNEYSRSRIWMYVLIGNEPTYSSPLTQTSAQHCAPTAPTCSGWMCCIHTCLCCWRDSLTRLSKSTFISSNIFS